MRTFLLLSAALVSTPALAQTDNAIPGQRKPEYTVTGSVNLPTPLPADLGKLRAPTGYTISIAASDLGNARIVTTSADGTVYVTRRTEADVLMLKDADGDGTYETRRIVAARPNLHGIALDGKTVYLVGNRELYSAPVLADGSFGELNKLVDDLPDAGQHANRTIAVGGNGMLYVSMGSTCNEPNQENATILQLSPDGRQRKIFASGLRNTIASTGTLQTVSSGAWIRARIGWAMKRSLKNSTASARASDTAGLTSSMPAPRTRTWPRPTVSPPTIGTA